MTESLSALAFNDHTKAMPVADQNHLLDHVYARLLPVAVSDHLVDHSYSAALHNTSPQPAAGNHHCMMTRIPLYSNGFGTKWLQLTREDQEQVSILYFMSKYIQSQIWPIHGQRREIWMCKTETKVAAYSPGGQQLTVAEFCTLKNLNWVNSQVSFLVFLKLIFVQINAEVEGFVWLLVAFLFMDV